MSIIQKDGLVELYLFPRILKDIRDPLDFRARKMLKRQNSHDREGRFSISLISFCFFIANNRKIEYKQIKEKNVESKSLFSQSVIFAN